MINYQDKITNLITIHEIIIKDILFEKRMGAWVVRLACIAGCVVADDEDEGVMCTSSRGIMGLRR